MGGGAGRGLDFGATYGSGRLKLNVKPSEPESLPQEAFEIGRSLGARALNYDIKDGETKKIYHFVEGTTISSVEVFAGKGVSKKLRAAVLDGLTERYGGKRRGWMHSKGIGSIDCGSRIRTAEVHWFEEKSVGRVEFKIKRWLS